jgi:hypothetical protein
MSGRCTHVQLLPATYIGACLIGRPGVELGDAAMYRPPTDFGARLAAASASGLFIEPPAPSASRSFASYAPMTEGRSLGGSIPDAGSDV